MGRDDHRLVPGQLGQQFYHVLLGPLIEKGRRLVEQQYGRVGDQGARETDALTLPAGQPLPGLPHRRVVALRAVDDGVVNAGPLGRGDDLLVIVRRAGQRDVVADRPVEEVQSLGQVADVLGKLCARELADLGTVQQHPAFADRIEAKQQLEQRALAAAVGAGNRVQASRPDLQGHGFDDRTVAARIAEADAVQRKASLGPRQFQTGRIVFLQRQQMTQAVERLLDRREAAPVRDQLHQRRNEAATQDVGGDERADRHLLIENGEGADCRDRHRVGQGDGLSRVLEAIGQTPALERLLHHLGLLLLPGVIETLGQAQGLDAAAPGQDLAGQPIPLQGGLAFPPAGRGNHRGTNGGNGNQEH